MPVTSPLSFHVHVKTRGGFFTLCGAKSTRLDWTLGAARRSRYRAEAQKRLCRECLRFAGVAASD